MRAWPASALLIKAHNQVCSKSEAALWIYDVAEQRLSHANDLPRAHCPLHQHIFYFIRATVM